MNMDNNDNQNVAGLPSLPINNEAFPISTDFYKTAFQFQQIMMIYESAIKQIETKLEILTHAKSATAFYITFQIYYLQPDNFPILLFYLM